MALGQRDSSGISLVKKNEAVSIVCQDGNFIQQEK
jgi:hypothetical protein